ncbi:hypothetical protein [Angustibacter luteus]|uniref:Uncharacterized protein n=1 Tax=Angustibacter luteus TaxID=658456 RepID=A0ABW1JIL6_9ACTN
MARTRFDDLFDEAAPLIERREHQRDAPPDEGGRWPISVLLPLDGAATAALDELTGQALALAGPGHFGTGLAGCAHVTVRSLETYRHDVPDDDPALDRYRSALDRATARSRPVALRLTGLTLTSLTVMACTEPVDDAAPAFAQALADELGPDSWREDGFRRDIWYATLVHFAADIAHPAELVAWVRERRRLDLGTTVARCAQLARFRFRDDVLPARMEPQVLATAGLRKSG